MWQCFDFEGNLRICEKLEELIDTIWSLEGHIEKLQRARFDSRASGLHLM